MRNIVIVVLTLIPSVAFASSSSSESEGVLGIVAAITALVTAATALVSALRGGSRAKRADDRSKRAEVSAAVADKKAELAESRAGAALAWADRLANAHSDGVVLVLSYPGARTSCRGLLEVNGWRIAHYPVTQAELDAGRLLPGPHVIDDVKAADAIVIEGLDEVRMATLAGVREFRDNIRSGCGVALFTAGENRRYDLALWGECDQGVTTPVTCEGAVRASLARREATARRQGIRPGKLAAVREEMLGARSEAN